MFMIKMGNIFLSVIPLYTALILLVDSVSVMQSDRYVCSDSCVHDGHSMIPMPFKASSRIQCAAECSKYAWCKAFIFLNSDKQLSSSRDHTSKSCQLYIELTLKCSQANSLALKSLTCNKVSKEDVTLSKNNSVTTQRVLQVYNNKTYFPLGQTYLETLLTAANNLKVQFRIGTSAYTASANYITLTIDHSKLICTSVLDSIQGSMNIGILITVRSFCTDGSQAIDTSLTSLSDQFFWDIQVPETTGVFRKNRVYTTGANNNLLVSSVTNGFDIKLLLISNKMIVHADVLVHDEKTGDIEAQSRIYERGKFKIISHLTGGKTVIESWTQASTTLSSPTVENTTAKWFSDYCWRPVFSRPVSTFSKSVINLHNCIETGRRIRIKFTIDNLTILASPDFVEVTNSTGKVTAYLLRVMLRKPASSNGVIGTVSNIIDNALTGTSRSQWAHYKISDQGIITTYTTYVRASEYTETSGTVEVQWFEEIQNWRLVYASDQKSVISLASLVAKVLNGTDVRIKILSTGIIRWYTCDMIEVIDNGQEVKCQVNGKVSLSTSTSNSTTLLGGVLSSEKPTTKVIISECFAAYALVGSIGPSSPCLWPGRKTPEMKAPKPERLDWFVPN